MLFGSADVLSVSDVFVVCSIRCINWTDVVRRMVSLPDKIDFLQSVFGRVIRTFERPSEQIGRESS